MGDQPATKKDVLALQKQVDEVRKWFQDEQKLKNEQIKWIYDELDKLDMLPKWFQDEKKVVHDALDGLQKALDELNKLKK